MSATLLTTLPITILQQVMRELSDSDIRTLILLSTIFQDVVDFDPVLNDGWQHGNVLHKLSTHKHRAKDLLAIVLEEKKGPQGFGKALIKLDMSLTPDILHAFDAQ